MVVGGRRGKSRTPSVFLAQVSMADCGINDWKVSHVIAVSAQLHIEITLSGKPRYLSEETPSDSVALKLC